MAEEKPTPDLRADDECIRLHALVHGRVQGVFFRHFTRQHAHRLRLVGWVRNLADGTTVEVIAEGPRAVLHELLTRVQQGPPGAHVENVDTHWSAASREFSYFRIR